MIVVDASAAVKWFVKEQNHLAALRLLSDNIVLAAPDLALPETANALWKKHRKGEISAQQSDDACHRLPGFFDDLVSSAHLITDAIVLARRLNHPVYDCTYLACGRHKSSPLVTADQAFIANIQKAGLGDLVVDLDQVERVLALQGPATPPINPEET